MVAGRYGAVAILRRRSEFVRVQSNGRRSRGRFLVLLALANPGGTTRVGFTVSKKVGHAVCRNRVRRCLREIVRRGDVVPPEGQDTVIIAYESAAQANSVELTQDLHQAFARLK